MAFTKTEMEDELRPEYDLTKLLKDGVRGKYANRYRAGSNVVVLAPDVARGQLKKGHVMNKVDPSLS